MEGQWDPSPFLFLCVSSALASCALPHATTICATFPGSESSRTAVTACTVLLSAKVSTGLGLCTVEVADTEASSSLAASLGMVSEEGLHGWMRLLLMCSEAKPKWGPVLTDWSLAPSKRVFSSCASLLSLLHSPPSWKEESTQPHSASDCNSCRHLDQWCGVCRPSSLPPPPTPGPWPLQSVLSQGLWPFSIPGSCCHTGICSVASLSVICCLLFCCRYNIDLIN